MTSIDVLSDNSGAPLVLDGRTWVERRGDYSQWPGSPGNVRSLVRPRGLLNQCDSHECFLTAHLLGRMAFPAPIAFGGQTSGPLSSSSTEARSVGGRP
jgi:hypothetical protein